MRKINAIITIIAIICILIGAAGLDAEEPKAAIIMIAIAMVVFVPELIYWRRIYER